MVKRQVFFSFDYDNDVMRVSQIKQMGVIENGTTLVSSNEWEKVKRCGDVAIEKWIDDNMQYKSCVIVLIGSVTYKSKWVKYEIEKAWTKKKALFGIYIHSMICPIKGKACQGLNPFEHVTLPNGQPFSSIIKQPYNSDNFSCRSTNAYDYIKNNLKNWIEIAIEDNNKR
jgi:hypothetical protein